ncbi:alpha/beta hydrolase family protein [Deinococcus yavapaiensis]|uniref:Prolyl oligopeptidase family protein n=1 Tax=Deinococcus yavapaiensis KR-236 TaxID=694435 RepID=A0A318SAX4_9DEIO|nr:prolyl oligopeptidase family serine peptidase [Deinococcus yavapaiensis]PYE56218.1 prolyl oligopeptidase family protein [Deinococcus yavapaiensis KR-236]
MHLKRLLALSALLSQPALGAPAVLLDRFSYRVGTLDVNALVCRPDGRAKRPLLNFVHGGLDTKYDVANCTRFARLGWVVAQSGLRGQNGSEGHPELCLGEVDDVLALARVAREKYDTDVRRVSYLGVSLGGCVALKAAARDPNATAVVTFVTPTDFAQQLDLLKRTRPDAVSARTAIFGGSPSEVPGAYEARRPLNVVGRVRASLLTVAAAQDPLIPLAQSCQVRDARTAAGRDVAQVRQKKDGTPAALPPQAWRRCDGERSSGTLPNLRRRDVLLIYDDLWHTSTPRMWRVAEAYLTANREPPSVFERLGDFFRRLF